MEKQVGNLNWDNMEFPVKVRKIDTFERNNPETRVNVYELCEDEKNIRPLRISQSKGKTANLLLLGDHYYVIRNMSRLIGSQNSRHKSAVYPCERCLTIFQHKAALEDHLEDCGDHEAQRVMYPKEGSQEYFKNYEQTQRHPFAITADFECILEKTDESRGKNTRSYNHHKPSGFSYVVRCMDDKMFPPELYIERNGTGKSVMNKMVEEAKKFAKRTSKDAGITVTPEESRKHRNATHCYTCGNPFGENLYRVRDHCHFTGKYMGVTCNKCNTRMRKPTFLPVLFHNLSGYDAHLFVKELGFFI